MKQVAIIVVTFNRLVLLQEEIESLRNQTFKDAQIVVINNGSTDGTSSWLEQQKDIITITQDNCGGAGGFFTGMKYVAEHGYKYCWLMDDDVICSPDALQELYNAYQLKPDMGFVCSKVQGIDGCEMNVPYPDCRRRGTAYQDIFEYLDRQMVKVKEATFVSVFLSTDIIRECGLPYREYFIWGDDSEYTNRVSDTHPCYLVGTSCVIHKRAIQGGLLFETETDPRRIQNFFYMFRNNNYRQYRNQNWRWKLRFLKNWIKMICRYKKAGEHEKATVLIKALKAIRTFNPAIQYPEKTI